MQQTGRSRTRGARGPFIATAALWACGLGAAACGPASGTDAGTDAAPPPASVCGNGVTEQAEACDDGNTESGDGCSVACLDEGPSVVCGNGWVEVGESCDDGGQTSGDGCDASCQIEPYSCAPDSTFDCGDVVTHDTTGGPSARADHCGLAEGGWDGPERIFRFDATTTEEVVFTLVAEPAAGTGLEAALGLAIVPDACEGVLCDAWALPPKPLLPGAPPATAVLAAVAGTSYYVYVDGREGAAGAFSLGAGCAAGAVCGNGVHEGGEGCDDGGTIDGDGCAATCVAEAPLGQCIAGTVSAEARVGVDTDLVRLAIDLALETDDVTASCAVPLPGCAGGPDAVLEILLAAGLTDLEVSFELDGVDVLLALSSAAPTCVEIACEDLFPATSGTRLFAGLTPPGGSVPTAVYLMVDACATLPGGTASLQLRGLPDPG